MNTENQFQSRPEFIRLPKSGNRCPYTGLSRTGLNDLILPGLGGTPPPVRSIVLKKPRAIRGIRLIDFDSLMNYLGSPKEEGRR